MILPAGESDIAASLSSSSDASCTNGCVDLQDVFITISDIYKDDLPDDSIFIFEYPSSHKKYMGNPMFLLNSSRYLVSNHHPSVIK